MILQANFIVELSPYRVRLRVRDIKTLVSRADTHQKVTPTEEKFNNQVDGLLHSEDSQPLIIAQLAHEQSGCGSRAGVFT